MKLFKRLFLAAALCLGMVFPVFGAGTVTNLHDHTYSNPDWSKPIRVIKWQIDSTDGTGSMSSTVSITGVTGMIIGMEVIPDSTNKPDDGWDVVVNDNATSDDVLEGSGANMPDDSESTNSHRRFPIEPGNSGLIFLFNKSLDVSVTNFNVAGTASAVLILYIQLP